MKCRFKLTISLCLLMLMSIGLTISTLHSHHHLEWSHPTEFADNGGQCITTDTTICPICGLLIQTDNLSLSHSGNVTFNIEIIVNPDDDSAINRSVVVNRGRSPPTAA